jgi:hypothetical protein
MAELNFRESDLVMVRLTLRRGDGGGSVTVNTSVTVGALGMAQRAGVKAPVFDSAEFARLLTLGGESAQAALDMQAAFLQETADFMAAGGAPPAESLAQAVVAWFVRTRPDGHTFTTDVNGEGYVLSEREINIHGPIDLGGGERGYRVTAVGTWGLKA